MTEENRLNRWLEEKLDKQFRDQLVRGSRLLHAQKAKEAIPLLRRAFELKPDHLEAGLNLGGAYVMAGQHRLAVPVLEKVAEMHPRHAPVWVNLGAARLGNPILADETQQLGAIEAWNTALQIDPYHPNVEYMIGLVRRDRGETELAIQAFERALAINPNDADARRLITRLKTQGDAAA
jgi:tetratricopeptide (TPR) repeat protein